MSNIADKIYSLRTDYQQSAFDETLTDANPFIQFGKWMEEALQAEITDANAMTLATCDDHLRPSLRVVLLRDFNENGFSFFTNYSSRKAHHISMNPWAALNFFWPELGRQIRIEGVLNKVSAQESDEYFASRPRESQIGAWASPQSAEIPSREILDIEISTFQKKFEGMPVPRPEHWGGYRMVPDYIEFWQGRASRLHDRILYCNREGMGWKKTRLAP
jgi:pyridoxamine 5'-phosphate oxidase